MLLDGAVSFYGDQSTFGLSSGSVLSSHVQDSLFQAEPRLLIEYEVVRGRTEWLAIEARDAASRTEQYAILQRLRAQILMLEPAEPRRSLGAPPLAVAHG